MPENMSTTAQDRVRARQEEIIGKPPRIPPLPREEVAVEVRAATARLRGGLLGDSAPIPLEAIPEIMFTLCRYPAWDLIMDMALEVHGRSTLSPRDRQLAVVRTAWLLGAPYEWGEHVKQSKKAGLSSEELERVTVGSGAPGWTRHERALLRAIEELRENAMISDETWATLSEQLSDAQMFELIALIGHFTNVAYIQNSLRLRLEPDNPGLTAR